MKLSDLVVSDVIASNSAFIGEEIPVTWTVKNKGEETTTSSYWYDNVFFSTDENLDDDDISLEYFYTNNSTALESQGSYEANTNIYIPAATPGNYYLLFVIDNDDNETEADETNNIYAHPLEVKFPDIASNISVKNGSINGDLNSEDIKTYGAYSDFYRIIDFNSGDFVTLNLTSSEFDTYTYLFLFDNNTLQSTKYNNDFGEGTDSQLSFIAQENIDYIVLVSSDEDEKIGNYTLRATTGEAPDINLKVTDATAPAVITFGENIEISWTVENQGTETTTANEWYDAVYLSEDAIFDESDIYIASNWNVDSIPLVGGENYTVTQSFSSNYLSNIGIGNRYLLFVTDEDDEQFEINEADNVYALEVELRTPDVDLEVTKTIAPDNATEGKNIEVSWEVTNKGTEATTASQWYDYVYLSDDETFDDTDSYLTGAITDSETPVEAGGSYTFTRDIIIPTATQAGNRYLLFITNQLDYQQFETDKSNNLVAVPINIKEQEKPNLFVSDANAPTSSVVGDTVQVSWSVTNNGELPTDANWYDSIYISDDQVLDSNDTSLAFAYAGLNAPLAPGENYTVTQDIILRNTSAGNRYLLFVTDSGNSLIEKDETDNVRAVAIELNAPDLVVTDATAPNEAILSEGINVSWTIKNQGSVTAPAGWSDYVYLSADNVLDDNDTYIRQFWVGDNIPLAAGTSYTFNETVTIPNITLDGNSNFYLLFAADRYDYQGETDETNNVKALQISLSAPDLVVDSPTAPESAILGESIEVSWTVKNQGNVTAPADWYDSIYLSSDDILDIEDTQIGYFLTGNNTPLGSNADYTLTQNITIPNNVNTGNYYLIFATDNSYYDGNGNQGETDENNNTSAKQISIGAPDLVIENAVTPESAVSGENINVSWTVKNQGSVTAPADWYDYIYFSTDDILDVNDRQLGSLWAGDNTPLAAGESYTATQDISIGNISIPGNYYLIFATDNSFYSDTYGNQGETDETNNTLVKQISIGAPDLVVSDASTTNSNVSLGQTVSASWTVANQGSYDAPTDWYDSIYLSTDIEFDSSDIYLTTRSAAENTPLAAGADYTATQDILIPNNIDTGSYYLLFITDKHPFLFNYRQTETDENNNVRALEINVSAPDLEVTSATIPNAATLGETIEVSWTVTNQGISEAPTDWFDYIYLSDDQIFDNNDTLVDSYWTQENTPLAAGASYTATQNVTIPTETATGNRYLLFVADGSESQGESNENNNVYAAAIALDLPDLVINATNYPEQIIWGETAEVSWKVENTGSSVAPADWYDYVYISDDENLDETDTVLTSEWTGSKTPLAPGDSYTVTQNVNFNNSEIGSIFSSVGTGDRYLLFVTDNDNNQDEADESNNVQAVEIKLTAPDLIVSNATAPQEAILEETVEVSWTVTNNSEVETANNWFDYVYISDDETLDDNDTLLTNRQNGDNTPVAPGESYTATSNITLDANTKLGSRYLLFVADKDNNQGESDETNNVKALPIEVRALDVDLVVSDISAPTGALPGQEIEIAWTVTNQGTEDATGTWNDHVYLSDDINVGNDQSYGSFSFTGTIAAGESIERRQTITLPDDFSGDRYLIVRTDANNQLLEYGKEDNNTTVDNQGILASTFLPNLQVTNVTAPETAFSSQETVVQWTVTNNGTGATSAPVWYDEVWLSLDQTFDETDTYLGRVANASYLNADESYNNSLTVKLPRGIDGNYYFLVKTDAENQVNEFPNEEDNFGVSNPTDVDLTPPPDLQVTSVNAPSQGFSGQIMSLSWVVTNEGTGRTLENNWFDEIIMSADEVIDDDDYRLGGLSHSGALDAGESYTATRDVTLPVGVSGDFYFFIRTDSGNDVFESAFESNNSGFDDTPTTINITPPPDLEVESVDVPTAARAGDELTINYRVTNFGATETPNSSWTDTFYLSVDDKLDIESDVKLGSVGHSGSLDAGAFYGNSASFTLDNQLTGDYYVFVATDSNDSVFELDNDNNTGLDAAPVTISYQMLFTSLATKYLTAKTIFILVPTSKVI